ncbi:trans-resveratrol di-O-methyltransferase-like [Lotus japonicus]|uniref:trans-resveratrol di-O-methyltransferase-like n=1 Tax=Lotus japonicus TaxID=34305 RepID=UPI002582CD73|nr:trans-resveratrol di-O-methyltransferase-like [Lotus japonicus]
MEIQEGERDAAKLLQALGHIWNHIFSFMNSMTLKCVVELGIPDIIHNFGKPMPLSQLIRSLPIHSSKAGNIHRLMRIMIHSDFFSQHNVSENELEVEYTLTNASMLLLKDHPFSMTPLLHFELDPILTNPWHHLSTWFKNETPTSFETAHGMLFWDYVDRDPKLHRSFNEGMASDSQLITSVFIEKCKDMFNGLESLVDVGGGTGTMTKAIAESFPQLKCTVLDLPHVVSGLQGSENLNYVGGDMFKEIPPTDAILLKLWILHDWSDDECLKILKKCKEAIKSKGKEGKVIIIDMVMEEKKEDHKLVETQLFFDMLMMVVLTGKERNKKEWVKLITSAGFNDYKITQVLGLRSIIEIYP